MPSKMTGTWLKQPLRLLCADREKDDICERNTCGKRVSTADLPTLRSLQNTQGNRTFLLDLIGETKPPNKVLSVVKKDVG